MIRIDDRIDDRIITIAGHRNQLKTYNFLSFSCLRYSIYIQSHTSHTSGNDSS